MTFAVTSPFSTPPRIVCLLLPAEGQPAAPTRPHPHLPPPPACAPRIRWLVPFSACRHRIEHILVSFQCSDMEGKKRGKSTKPRSAPFQVKHAVEYGLRVDAVDPESHTVTRAGFVSHSVARRFRARNVRRQNFSKHSGCRSGQRIVGPICSASIRRSGQCTRNLQPVKNRLTSM